MKNITYSFFGTCYEDVDLTIDCIKSISSQTILPKEVILINSGSQKIKKQLENLLLPKKVKLIYIEKKLSRIKSLNLAIAKTNSQFIFRFDSRSRFQNNFAQIALNIFSNNPDYVFIGGVPKIIASNNSFNATTSAGILSRPYVFGYPRHRQYDYEGHSNSVYLGCFNSSILKKIMYRENIDIISEDSLIASDFLEAGYKPFISSKLKLSYLSRPSILLTIRLFNTYGFCRSNTLLSSFKIHSPLRYIALLFIILSMLFFFFINFKWAIIYSLLIVFSYNFISEIIFSRFKVNFKYPILAIICQFSWFLGFIRGFLSYHNIKSKKSNYIK